MKVDPLAVFFSALHNHYRNIDSAPAPGWTKLRVSFVSRFRAMGVDPHSCTTLGSAERSASRSAGREVHHEV